MRFLVVILFWLSTLPVSAQQIFGTNTGTFADYLPTKALETLPLRAFGTAADPFSPHPEVNGPNGSLIANFGAFTYAMNYPNGNYVIQLDSPSPVTVTTAGILHATTSTNRIGTHTTITFPLQHDAGGIKTGNGWVTIHGVSASNPVSNFTISGVGTDPRDTTPEFNSFRNIYGATRWMNNLNINNNTTQMTPASLVTPGYNAGQNSYDDIVKWTNEQPSQKAVLINVPINVTDGFLAAVAQKLNGVVTSKKIIVEYSNEVWNGTFTQFGYNYNAAASDPRCISSDGFGRAGEEYGLQATHVMDVIKANFTGPATLIGFLGSQGTNTYFVDKAKSAITRIYGPTKLASDFGYQGISFYPGDAITGASSAQDLFNQLEADLPRQVNALITDRNDAAADGLTELVYEWSPNGYLTHNGVSQAVIDSFRASTLSKTFTTDLISALKANVGANGVTFSFDVVGDGWAPQIDTLAPHEPEQQAIDAAVPEPSSGVFGLVVLGILVLRQRTYKFRT